jgi:pimeloyl-ACP methyl ester carboxylesterase
MQIDPRFLTGAARSFFRPIGWRDTTPDPRYLEGCLLFDRDRRATSFDGTEIAYGVHGRRGPWVVLVPGFCCPDNFWRYLLPELKRSYRVIVYDLRGLGLSGLPRSPGFRARNLQPSDFAMDNHARDLEAVLDAEGIRKAALIGHSMGGQIILEAYRHLPERVDALVFLTALFESAMGALYGRDTERWFIWLTRFLRILPRPTVLLWRTLFLANPGFTNRMAQLVRALGPDAKVEDMATYYRHLAFLDPLVLLKMAEAMHEHSAIDLLPDVRVPTLIAAGDIDMFAPIHLAKLMKDTMPDAELAIVEGAAHGGVIEKPIEVNRAVLSFLDRRVRGAGPAVPAVAGG